MGFKLWRLYLLFAFAIPTYCADIELIDPDFRRDDSWLYRNTRREIYDESCARVNASTKDIVRRVYAILPYFDRDRSNIAFLQKFRATIHMMFNDDDLLNREVAFYAAVLTPLVFFQQQRDTWCLIERFHRAIRLYQISHPTEKRPALKLLQNFRAASQKVGHSCICTIESPQVSRLIYRNVQILIKQLPGSSMRPRTSSTWEPDEEELHEKKDIRYV